MIKTLSLPIVWKYNYSPAAWEDYDLWRKTQRSKFDEAESNAKDELNSLLAKGFVVLSSHLWDDDNETVIFYVLYLSPDKVELPY